MYQEQNDSFSEMAVLVGQMVGLPEDQIDDDANLIRLGIDSVSIMRVAGALRKAGYEVSFAELIASPTLAAWRGLAAGSGRNQGAVPVTAVPTRDLSVPAPVEIDEEAAFDLALMQHAYWVGRDDSLHLGGVAAHFYHEFDAERIDPDRLDVAVRALRGRHGMLRVRILDDGRQQISSRSAMPGVTVYDLRTWAAKDARQKLDELRTELSHRRMDIAAGEVFDVRLSLLPDTVHSGGVRIHINLDMVAADALSLRGLMADLARLYLDGKDTLPPLRTSYPRYLAERRALRAVPERAAALDRDREYWNTRLPDLPSAPVLPTASGKAEAASTVVRRHRWLDPDCRRGLEQSARGHGLTVAMVLAATLAEILTAYSTEADFLLNLPLFDREPLHPDVGALVGDFTSSILLEWRGHEAGTFVERAARLQDRFHKDASHAAYSGVEVLRDASRLHGRQVFAPVVFTSALGLGDLFGEDVRKAFGQVSWIISQGPQVWLDAQVTELDGGLLVNWDARESAFAPGMLDEMFNLFSTVLDRLLTDPDSWSRPVPSLLPVAQIAVRAKVNATSGPVPSDRLHDGFFAAARRTPDAPALFWGETERLSYGELADGALRVAAYLRGKGIGRDELVALSLPKGPRQIIAVLGVLAAGAAYLPINIDQPQLRKDRILSSSGARLVIDDLSPAMCVGPLPSPLDGEREDLAYVLYTSGSTGEPKGVELTHVAAMNTIADLNRRFQLGSGDRTLAVSALDFDLSVFDIFSPLSVGGAVVCVEEGIRRDATAWVDLVRRHEVTVLNCVPALAEMLVTGAEGGIPSLRLVLLGGDWVPLSLPGALLAVAPESRCIALGGTTETAIHSTIQEASQVLDHWVSVPYGTPLRNVRCRVVDVLGRDRPDLVPGELWIGGAGVARGYRGDPVRTADRFVTVDGLRWYRTGDLARYLPGGVLEFLGRMDHQVKILGHRIELGEVEAALDSHPHVAHGVAIVGQDGRLTAVVVPTQAGEIEEEDLRAHLTQRLPAAMIPSRIVTMAQLPLSANGKVDRDAIRRASAVQTERDEEFLPPQGETERRVAAIWEEILKSGRVGRDRSFFSLGGDSLLATRLVARLRAEGFAEVGLSDIFTHPVLMDFAAMLRPDNGGDAVGTLIADFANRHQPFPATDVQRAYLFGRGEDFALGGIGCHFYREFEVENLDVPRLEDAVNRLIQRHEMLRAVFDEQGNQRILAETPRYQISVEEAGADAVDAFTRQRATASHRVFSPDSWPLFAVSAVQDGSRARVAIGIDNLILDALSILVFYEELGLLYQNPAAELPLIDVSFRDYMLSVQPDSKAVAAAWNYWSERVPDMPPAPQLPLSIAPATVTAPHFVRRERRVSKEVWGRILERARGYGITPSALLLGAYAEVLGRWSSRPDLTINLTLFDRKDVHPDINRVLGDFTSLVLVRAQPLEGESWLDRVRRIQAEVWGALDHREVSAIRVLRELSRRTGEAETTMPVVFTSALGIAPMESGTGRSVFDRHVWGVSQTPQVWLDHQVTDCEGGVCLTWDAVEELFPSGLLDTMFDAYWLLLQWLSGNKWTQPVFDLMPASQQQVRKAVNDTGLHAPERLLHADVFARAQEAPDQPAVLWDGGTMTFGELADKALRVAATLSGLGVGRGDTVAITLPKGPDQVIAVLGILAAGASYVPVGTGQPSIRRDRIYQTARAVAVITDAAGLASSSWAPDRAVILIENAMGGSVPLPRPVESHSDDLAYVIFTSGSTGEPKGVEITHRAAANTVSDVNERCRVEAADRVLAVSALDFDLSVYDLFGPLSVGGAIVMIDENSRREARTWLHLVRKHGVTVWNSVPALLDMLLLACDGTLVPDSLRVVLVSGDWVGLDLPGRLAALCPRCRLLALGGATEAAIWSNMFEVFQVDPVWRSIPYGTPLRNQRFRVVDALGRDCPDLVSGELWIGGAGVARGYRGQPEATARVFRHVDGERWYRTGDLGRYWPNGTLEFLGRADLQVKLRGHRIELGEVEAALKECPGVDQAVAAIAGEGGARHLVAAVVPRAVVFAAPAVTVTTDAVLRSRERDRQMEAEAVEVVLARLLGLDRLSNDWDPAARLGVTEENLPVLRLWLNWLEGRRVLSVGRDGYTAGTRLPEVLARSEQNSLDQPQSPYGALVLNACRRLVDRLDDYRAILAGRMAAAVLLDDDVLAPGTLSAHDPGTREAISAIAAEVTRMADTLGRPVEIAEYGGRDGRTAAMLLEMLDPDKVRYTLLDPAAVMVGAARRRLNDLRHVAQCEQVAEDRISEALRYRFDMVIAVNALHRARLPGQGPALVALLLRRDGVVMAVERCQLTPVAMMTAAVLDTGYADLDQERRSAGSPMLSGSRWAEHFAQAGFVGIQHHAVGESFVEMIQARRPASAIDLDTALLREQAAHRLPAHMVPERIEVLAWLPLTANGKVERSLVAGATATVGLAKDEAPRSDMEDAVVEMWKELLEVAAIGRTSRFFEMGGDSLRATRFLARVRERFGVDLPLRRMFAASSLAEVADAIGQERGKAAQMAEAVEEGAL